MVVISTDDALAMTAYLRESEVAVDQVASFAPGDLKIPATPFLMLVDEQGVVRKAWRGKLPPSQEKEVFAAIGLPDSN